MEESQIMKERNRKLNVGLKALKHRGTKRVPKTYIQEWSQDAVMMTKLPGVQPQGDLKVLRTEVIRPVLRQSHRYLKRRILKILFWPKR